MEKKTEKAVRIQTSLLNPYEKKILVWMGERVPKCIVSDHLSFLGFIGAVVIALGYFLTNYHPGWLWFASFGFVLNWVGDSLDGTLARVRHTQRPIYGFYIDHSLDCICEFLMVGGAGLMAYMHAWSALLIVVPYLMLEVSVMMNSHLRNEFNLTYGKLGPTEFRLILIGVNTALFFMPSLHHWHTTINVLGLYDLDILPLDIVGVIIAVILFVIYMVTFFKDAHYYATIDPLKKTE